VRVVTLNFNGGDLTLACIATLHATDWPTDRLDITLVDNASRDGVVDAVRGRWPGVRIISSGENLGFAGGMNLGLRALDDVDYVALVNNDVTVSPGWLRPLVDALVDDPGLGAACPKILFSTPFVEIELEVPTSRRGRGDRRELGARVSGARVGGDDVGAGVQLLDGFWGPEPAARADPSTAAQWTRARARLRVPTTTEDPTPSEIRLRVESETPRVASAHAGGDVVELALTPTPTWFSIPVAGVPIEVVNSTGALLTTDGFGSDRGYLEPDDGRFDEPADVFAWSGAAVLLSRPYLDDVGAFDERLFLYYEDLELSWRGQERGWRYRYVPRSVVRHVHSATIGEHSGLARYQNERNRLLVLARHSDTRSALTAAARSLLVTASYARRDIVSPLLRGHRPHAAIVDDRVRAFGGYIRRLPATLRARRQDRARG
jgi:GT2 family glycosyltransferase